MRTRVAFRWLASLALAASCLPASAGTLCTAVAVPPVFTGYSMARVLGIGKVTVTCTVAPLPADVSYTVQLGLGPQAVGTQRRMLLGLANLNYNLHCDAALAQVWADGSAGSCTVAGGKAQALGVVVSDHAVYGSIPAGQQVLPGLYADVVPVVVLY